MKKHITLLSLLLLVASVTMAQDFETPQRGAKIYAQEYSVDIDASGEASFDLWIVRSKYARKSKFSTPKLNTSSGLAFDVQQDSENKDHFIVKVNADNVADGQYTVMVSSSSTGIQKIVGATLSFNVAAGKAVASKDGE